jgi:hypothetical protein
MRFLFLSLEFQHATAAKSAGKYVQGVVCELSIPFPFYFLQRFPFDENSREHFPPVVPFEQD